VTTDSGVASWRADGLWTVRGQEGTVLTCPGAASRRDCLMGVQLGFMGVQLDGKVIWAGLRAVRELPAVAGGCRRAFLGMKPRDAVTAVRPWHGRRPGPPPSSFPQVTRSDCAAGWHCRLPLPAKCRPGRPLVVLAWAGDGSPIW